MAKRSGIETEEQIAREKLELVLLDLQAKKYTDITYNETDYIDKQIRENGMIPNRDLVFVDGWQFTIDRTVPKIGEEAPKKNAELAFTFGDKTDQYNGISGKCEEFIVPCTGYYKLEVWGAQGGHVSLGGKGGYSSGYINLQEGEKLYVYLGGRGANAIANYSKYLKGGFNGGGDSGKPSWFSPHNSYGEAMGSGGGATDIRKVKATEGSWYDENHQDWISDSSLLSRIIVAGGGRGSEVVAGKREKQEVV